MAKKLKTLPLKFAVRLPAFFTWTLSFIVTLSALPFAAHAGLAAGATATLTQATSFSDVICNVESEMNGYSTLISAICYVCGAFIVVRGVLYLSQRFSNGDSDGQGNNAVKGIAHLLGGGALLSAPTFVYILQNSLFLSPIPGGGTTACGGTAPVALTTGLGLDEVMMNFSRNISRPMFMVLSGLAFAIGIFLIVRALMKAAKYGVDPRSDNVKSIITNLMIGAILISIGNILPTILMSLFGISDVDKINSFSGINWSSLGLAPSATLASDNAIKAGLAFVQIVGGIAFLRGWLMIKNAIEGTGQQTVPQGLTHIIGGAMAINIGTMLHIIDTTFGTGLVLP